MLKPFYFILLGLLAVVYAQTEVSIREADTSSSKTADKISTPSKNNSKINKKKNLKDNSKTNKVYQGEKDNFSIPAKKYLQKKRKRKKPLEIESRDLTVEIDYLARAIALDMNNFLLANRKSFGRVPIISFELSPNLVYTLEAYTLTRLSQIAIERGKRGDLYLFKALKTLRFRTKIEEEKVVVTKGAYNEDELRQILLDYDVDYYVESNLRLQGRILKLEVRIMDASTLLPVKSFSATVKTGLSQDLSFSAEFGQNLQNQAVYVSLLLGKRLYGFGEIAMLGKFNSIIDLDNSQFSLSGSAGIRIYLSIGELTRIKLGFLSIDVGPGITIETSFLDSVNQDNIFAPSFLWDLNARFLLASIGINFSYSAAFSNSASGVFNLAVSFDF